MLIFTKNVNEVALSNPLSILVAVLYISPYFPSDFFDLHIQSSLRTISSPILKYNHIYISIKKTAVLLNNVAWLERDRIPCVKFKSLSFVNFVFEVFVTYFRSSFPEVNH